MQDYLGEITLQNIVSANVEEIQKCGLSMRKAGYIKGIGEAVGQGKINMEELWELPDDEVIKRLSSLHGVGVWTAGNASYLFHGTPQCGQLGRPRHTTWHDECIRIKKSYKNPI